MVHLTRLVAADTGYAIGFDNKGGKPTHYGPDADGSRVLAKVVRALTTHRVRARKRARDALATQLHAEITRIFVAAQVDREMQAEEQVAEYLRSLAFELTDTQISQFIRGPEDILGERGAANAAANALGRAVGWDTGKNVFEGKKRVRELPPVPAPLNRWVPLPLLRDFLAQVMTWETRRRAIAGPPTLSMFRSGNDVNESLIICLEKCLQKGTQRLLEDDPPIDELALVVRGLFLTGEWSGPELAPAMQETWGKTRARFADLIAQTPELDHPVVWAFVASSMLADLRRWPESWSDGAEPASWP